MGGRAVTPGGINLTITLNSSPTSDITVAGTYIVTKQQAPNEVRPITLALSDTTVTNLYSIIDVTNAKEILLRDLTVYNPAGNATHTATIKYSDGTVTYVVFVAELQAGWFLLHQDTIGWTVYNDKGQPQSSLSDIITGPFRVEAADTAVDYIEIDPENAQIVSGGAAQPTTWNGLQYDIWIPPATGDYTTGLLNVEDGTGSTPGADLLWGVPIILPRTGTYDAIQMSVDGVSAGGNARAGIYNSGSDWLPGTLLIDAGTFTTDATGTKTVTMSDTVIGPGLFWLCFVTDTNGGLATVEKSQNIGAATIKILDAVASQPIQHCHRSFTYAVLPDPYGTPIVSNGGLPWRLRIRAA